METIKNFFRWLWEVITGFPGWVVDVIKAVFGAIWEFFTDLVIAVFDMFMGLIVGILNSLNFDFSIFNPASYLASAPPELVNVIGLVRVPEAIAMILVALGIRLVLQLVPFTRLGS